MDDHIELIENHFYFLSNYSVCLSAFHSANEKEEFNLIIS